MRAIHVTRLDGPTSVSVVDLEDPSTDDSLVVIDVRAVGVAFPDVLLTRGLYQYKPDLPFIPGGEIAGVVKSAPEHSGFSPGDRVAALTGVGGAMAEAVSLSPETVFPLPDNVSFEAGAGLLFNYLTMQFALRHRGHLRTGETVLIHGAAGGVGSAALQLAPCFGAARTIAVVSSQEKAQFASQMGASDVVLVENWREDVMSATDGKGVDVIVDTVGGDRFTDSVRSLSTGGRILVLGFAAGDIPVVKVNRLLLKNAAVIGVAWGSWWMEEPTRLISQWAELAPLLSSGLLTAPEPTRFPLESAADALTALERRRAVGKIVLTVR
jgi:NADPH2:quinone reductase